MTTSTAQLIAAVRTLATDPYNREAVRIVSHSLLREVEAAREVVRAEQEVEKQEIA